MLDNRTISAIGGVFDTSHELIEFKFPEFTKIKTAEIPEVAAKKVELEDLRGELIKPATETYLKYAAKNNNLHHALDASLRDFHEYVIDNKDDEKLVEKFHDIVSRVNELPKQDIKAQLLDPILNQFRAEEDKVQYKSTTERAKPLIEEMIAHADKTTSIKGYTENLDFEGKVRDISIENNQLTYKKLHNPHESTTIDVSNSTVVFETKNNRPVAQADFSQKSVVEECTGMRIFNGGTELNLTKKALQKSLELLTEGESQKRDILGRG